jgi:uncharacterized membrane protein YbhN (UPF0104 family)
MLLPTVPGVGFISILVVFVSATLLGFASHAPGGLGVFDAAMLVALWQFDKEDVLAGLLIFRVLYYLVPFAFALLILGLRELWLNTRGVSERHEMRTVRAAEPLRSEVDQDIEKTGTR